MSYNELNRTALIALHNEKAVANNLPEMPAKSKENKAAIVGRIEAIDALMSSALGEDAPKKRSIKAAALDYMTRVDFFESKKLDIGEDNRCEADDADATPVGFTYAKIIDMIKEEFPECETSVECLRWYAVRVNHGDDGYNVGPLPRRPRKVSKKRAKVEATEEQVAA